ncbi:MAG TPA: hypothetical protein VFN61_04525 [Acidimicrobiales bacterium]|nr:hypothetical protein [Acidimicrobiales bacterium]
MSVLAPLLTGADVGSALASGSEVEDFDEEERERDRRGKPKSYVRAAKRHDSAHQTELASLHDAAKRGLQKPEGLGPEEEMAWSSGVQEARQEASTAARQKAAANRKAAGKVVAGAAGHLRSAANKASPGAVASDITSGSSLSGWGAVVGVLLVIALYLFLSRANLATKAVSGVFSAVRWLVSPKPLPF